MNTSAYVTSLIRTFVPIIVGGIIALLATLKIDVDAETSAALIIAITGVCQGIYYAVVRAFERAHPAAGVLLGVAVPPVYVAPPATPGTP